MSAVEATLRAQGTVVLLMGVRTLPDTVASLLSRGIEADTPLATIENGFSEKERVTVTTLRTLSRIAHRLRRRLLPSSVRSCIMLAIIRTAL